MLFGHGAWREQKRGGRLGIVLAARSTGGRSFPLVSNHLSRHSNRKSRTIFLNRVISSLGVSCQRELWLLSQSQPPRIVVVVSESSTSISPEQRLPVANATRTSISTSVTPFMIDLPRPALVSSRPPKPCHLSPPTTLRGQQQLGPLPSNPRLTCIHKSSHRPSFLAATDTSHMRLALCIANRPVESVIMCSIRFCRRLTTSRPLKRAWMHVVRLLAGSLCTLPLLGFRFSSFFRSYSASLQRPFVHPNQHAHAMCESITVLLP